MQRSVSSKAIFESQIFRQATLMEGRHLHKAICTHLAISLSFALLISLSSAAFFSALALLESFSYNVHFKVKVSITNETLLEFTRLNSDTTNHRTVKQANFTYGIINWIIR